MKLCVIGNSHAAALRKASGLRGAPGAGVDACLVGVDVDAVDAFAIAGDYGPALVLEGMRLRPRNPDARVETTVPCAAEQGMDLSDYDQVLFSAVGLPAVRQSFVHHVLVAHAHAAWWCGDPPLMPA